MPASPSSSSLSSLSSSSSTSSQTSTTTQCRVRVRVRVRVPWQRVTCSWLAVNILWACGRGRAARSLHSPPNPAPPAVPEPWIVGNEAPMCQSWLTLPLGKQLLPLPLSLPLWALPSHLARHCVNLNPYTLANAMLSNNSNGAQLADCYETVCSATKNPQRF